jgi:hypothetical protein
MVKSKQQVDNYINKTELVKKEIQKKKLSSRQALRIEQQQQQLSIEGQSSIEAIVSSTTTTIQYSKAREWINENVMDWVEFEKIKIANEKGRALTKVEVAGIKKMEFEVSKIVDQVQYGHIVKWNKYPYKYNTVYNPRLAGNNLVYIIY